MTLTPQQESIINDLQRKFDDKIIIAYRDMIDLCQAVGISPYDAMAAAGSSLVATAVFIIAQSSKISPIDFGISLSQQLEVARQMIKEEKEQSR